MPMQKICVAFDYKQPDADMRVTMTSHGMLLQYSLVAPPHSLVLVLDLRLRIHLLDGFLEKHFRLRQEVTTQAAAATARSRASGYGIRLAAEI